MKIGIPKEIKVREARASCTPQGAQELVKAGHAIYLEKGAGLGAGYSDQAYIDAGATIVANAAEAWAAEIVLKVKEPIEAEYKYLRPNLILFTYLHLAANPELTAALCQNRVTGIAYETMQVGHRLPLLEPMSEIAGKMSALMGSYHLSKSCGGKGIMLGGVPGVPPGEVMVLGGGTAGLNAARVASGIGANVTLLDINLEKMRFIDLSTGGTIRTLYSTEAALMERLNRVDLLIGAVLIPGSKAPRLINRDCLKQMKPGSVFVDIAIDQGGCSETSRPTTHEDPIYTEEGIIHYCVANMPGAYPRTSTQALTNSTLPYILKLANLGLPKAMKGIPELRSGLNTFDGQIVYSRVADAIGQSAHPNPFTA